MTKSPRSIPRLPRRLVVHLALAALVLGAACGPEEASEWAASESALAVPGPWSPPASTRTAAASQYVSVIDPPAVSPLGHCTSSNPFQCSCTHPACSPAYPGTVELDRFLRARFSYLRSGGLFCCRQNSATTSVPKLSVHAIGRAIDLMVPMSGGDADNALGDQVANWLVENAEFIGVQRVVWDRAFWNGERGFGLLGSSSSPHTDHLHIELSTNGAAMRTPFFTSGAYAGTCTARCEGSRLIATDCSSTECAASGAQCLSGPPPHCGQPPPPEPPEATPVAGAAKPTMRTVGVPGRLTFVTPERLFDSRTAASSADLVRADNTRAGPLGAAGANTWRPSSSGSLPTGAKTLWLNLAIIPATAPGFATAVPAGAGRPATSTVNFVPGGVRANAAPVVLGSGEGVSFYTSTEVDAIADLTGVFGPSGAGLVTAGPTRVLDTRAADYPLLAGETREVDVRAPADATGVVASVAIIGGPDAGYVIAFACGSSRPGTSNINFGAGAVVANTVVSKLGSGKLCVWAAKEAHLIVDVTGYLTPTAPLAFQALEPQRLLDTRSAASLYTGRLGARQVIELPIQGLPGMPGEVWSVAANLTAVGASGPGHLTAFPCGGATPSTSSLNFNSEGAFAALTVSSVGGSGKLCVFTSTRTHLIVDVVGVWVHTGATQPPASTTPSDPADQGDTETPPEASEEPPAGGGSEGGSETPPDASGGGSPEPPAGGGNEGGSETPSDGTGGEAGEPPPSGDSGVEDDPGSRAVIGVGRGGCSVAPGAPAPFPAALTLLMLVLWRRRRP